MPGIVLGWPLRETRRAAGFMSMPTGPTARTTEAAMDKQTRIVVVEVNGAVLGVMVDAVSEVLRLPASTVEPAPRIGAVEREYVRGVGKLDNRLLILLDLDQLMSQAEEEACAEIAHP